MDSIRLGAVQLAELEEVLGKFANQYVYGFDRSDALVRAKLVSGHVQGTVLIMSLCGLEIRKDIGTGWFQVNHETWEISMGLHLGEGNVVAAVFRKPALNPEMAGRYFPRLILASTREAVCVEWAED